MYLQNDFCCSLLSVCLHIYISILYEFKEKFQSILFSVSSFQVISNLAKSQSLVLVTAYFGDFSFLLSCL